MEKNNERIRHIVVTIWLWASTLGNLAGALLFIKELHDNPGTGVLPLFFYIIVIMGNILVFNWKIIGVFINLASCIALLLLMIFHYDVKAAYPLAISAISVLVYIGILNIRQNGISTLRHLINTAKENKRHAIIWSAAALASILLAIGIVIFPVKIIYGNIIALFAPGRMVSSKYYDGRVLGRHILKTEYGEIKLGFLCNVTMAYDEFGISYESFESGQASHRLVVEGIRMPKNIIVWVSHWWPHAQITKLGVLEQRLNISGIHVIPARLQYIYTSAGLMTYEGSTLADLYLSITFENEYIILADSTVIDVRWFVGNLLIYRNDETWELESSERLSSILVTFPGETEYTEYESIVVGKDWGNFIKGELLLE